MWWRGGGSCGDGRGVIVNTLGCKASTTRSVLKTSVFLVERPGNIICADLELLFFFFFFFLSNFRFYFFPQNFFSHKQ